MIEPDEDNGRTDGRHDEESLTNAESFMSAETHTEKSTVKGTGKIEKKSPETPLLKQFYDIKSQFPDTLLLYRVGDFYETFGEDARKASKILGIVLTRRASGSGTFTELAGVPYHAIDTYLPKLVQAGCKVAVCDQLEDPKLTKKLVKRGVTELVTPGVAYNDNLLRQKENNFVAAVTFNKDGRWSRTPDRAGVAFLDISTGTFKVAQGSLEYLEVLISEYAPKEILVERGYVDGFRSRFGSSTYVTTLDEWAFVYESCRKKLLTQMGTDSLKGFGIENLTLATTAAGAVLFYLEITKHTSTGQITSISRIDMGDAVWMDRFTMRNLELFSSFASGEGTSLLDVIDRTCSPMGARLLREWLARPLNDIKSINARYDCVSALTDERQLLDSVREKISEIGDLERLVSKAAAGRISPREVLQLSRGLKSIGEIRSLLKNEKQPLKEFTKRLDSCSALSETISRTILQEAAPSVGKGDVIARGVNHELDSIRDTLAGGKQILLDIQQNQKEITGIPSLRISYNNVFGYYLEVRNMYRDKVPSDWIRKQTLVNAERYITPQLKEYEEKIFGAQEKIYALEASIYSDLVAQIQKQIAVIQKDASTVAQLDCLESFATVALSNNYCRPQVDDSYEITIKEGRHPVIETLMNPGEEYIANDLYLNSADQQIIILTGPNMAGKSAFLRQTALIVLLAQIGCFVPAKEARIGLVDKIFTRVGASDNISRGESTFMVEMTESATILNNITPRSLVLLDEIGRGTSTYDGMSIAWSMVEYLHNNGGSPRTLFATHYHELNELESLFPRVRNFHISVKEQDGRVIFLRKLARGGVSHSFGIHVARLAGMPASVINAAHAKLKELESFRNDSAASTKDESAYRTAVETDNRGATEKGNGPGSAPVGFKRKKENHEPIQLSLYQLDDPLLLEIKDELKKMDINTMSPLDAFDALRSLKKRIGLKEK